MVFIVAKNDDTLCGKQFYHEGESNFLFLTPRMYGDRKAAIANLRQWVSICLGRRVVFKEKQGFSLVRKGNTGDYIGCILRGL